MSEYKVTVKVIETYTYNVDDASSAEDAIAQAFEDRLIWSYRYDSDEFSVIAEEVDA